MATTIDRIDLGCARNLMRVRIRLTAPLGIGFFGLVT